MSTGDAGGLIGQTLGGYRLVDLLGVGGMAEVYRGEDIRLGRMVAVKVLPPLRAADASFVRRFRDEARRVAALNHPNIVPVYHFDEQDGLLFLVMPLQDESLRQRTERVGLLPIDDAVRVTVQIAAALDAAHAQGIVHRDVKPENILLNAQGTALLSDFGIARQAEAGWSQGRVPQTFTEIGLPIGTPEYMPPEQLRSAMLDGRADIYALGAVLYELLAGRAPHEADTPLEVASLTLSAPVTPPSAYNPAVWPELDAVVMTALAYEPSDRFPDALHFADALQIAMAAHSRSPLSASLSASDWRSADSGASPTMPGFMVGDGVGASGALVALRFTGASAFATGGPGGSFAVIPGAWPLAPEKRRRARGPFVALLIIALLAVLGTSALLITGGFPGSPLAAQNALGGQATNTQALPKTPGSTRLPGATGVAGTPEAVVTATPSSAVTSTRTVTGTPVSTDTPTFGPTATPGLPSVVMPNFSVGGKHPRCEGTQSITNTGSNDIAWSWSPPNPMLPPEFKWEFGTGGTPANPGLPNHSDLAPGATDTVTIAINCDKNDHLFTITGNASDVGYPSQSTMQMFTMDVHGS